MAVSAALNTLREERRRVVEARAAVMGDLALMASDPAHRRRLLDQMLIEMVEHDQAIVLIERAQAEAVEARIRTFATPPLKPRQALPVPVGALRTRRAPAQAGGRL